MVAKHSQRGGDDRTPDKRIGEVAYADNTGGSRDKPAGKAARKSSLEGPAAYAPHNEDEDVRANPDRDPAKKKTGEF